MVPKWKFGDYVGKIWKGGMVGSMVSDCKGTGRKMCISIRVDKGDCSVK